MRGLAVVVACMVLVCSEAQLQALEAEELGESAGSPLQALHSQNAALIQQIESIQGGGGAPAAGPAGPSAMAGLMAMPPPGGGGGGEGDKQAGIKEALTAVKPIMDKYVNTAKTLTGKYTALKQAYAALKAKKAAPDPKLDEKVTSEIKKAKAEDKVKLDALQQQYKALEIEEAALKSHNEREETKLKQNAAKLEVTNQNVAKLFQEELAAARKSAKNEIKSMRGELNHFLAASNKARFDALGEATEKAMESKKDFAMKSEQINEEVKVAVEAEAKKEEKKVETKEDGEDNTGR